MACLLSSSAILFVVLVNVCQAVYVPVGFACTKDQTTTKVMVYSTPQAQEKKVDLIHIFCGQVYGGGAHGFHARPGDADPASAKTSVANLNKAAASTDDFAVYRNPQLYDTSGGGNKLVDKHGISGIWPTSLSMEKTTQYISHLEKNCSPPDGKNACVKNVSVVKNVAPYFDVMLILKPNNGDRYIRTAYPVAINKCKDLDAGHYKICDFNGW